VNITVLVLAESLYPIFIVIILQGCSEHRPLGFPLFTSLLTLLLMLFITP